MLYQSIVQNNFFQICSNWQAVFKNQYIYILVVLDRLTENFKQKQPVMVRILLAVPYSYSGLKVVS